MGQKKEDRALALSIGYDFVRRYIEGDCPSNVSVKKSGAYSFATPYIASSHEKRL